MLKRLLSPLALLAATALAGASPANAADLAADGAMRVMRAFNARSLRMAITDLSRTYGSRYPRGAEFLRRLEGLEASRKEFLAAPHAGAKQDDAKLLALGRQLNELRYEALLANPLLDFDRLILVRRAQPLSRSRGAKPGGPGYPPSRLFTAYGDDLGLPKNHYSTFSVRPTGYDNEIAALSPVRPDGKLSALFRPANKELVGDVRLHWDAGRFLFTKPDQGRWQVFELRADGSGLRQVTPGDQPDVDNYDATYLPDGRIIFCSTANYQAIPCWNGLQAPAGLYIMNAGGAGVRQLTFDQDDDSCPTVLNSGQVLYNRWEYTNTPHIFTHMLFQMNPDGTGQRAFYGSNSYWPNALYFARAIPGHATRIVAVVSGHHGDNRMGELVIFDPAKARTEAGGVVQRIPGYGQKVEPIIKDELVSASWPKFLHPDPLSEKYFLVSAKTAPDAPWAIYLVDVFDNMLLIRAEDGYALLEPTAVHKRPPPPIVPGRVDLKRKDAVVYLQDVHAGPGLAGVPRGTVKKLRVHGYHFGYRGVAGWDKIGIDGPWDVMRILGTVPVDADGSAMFRVPANTPIAVQPLDAAGRALQVMRSWFTAMPGEVRSCIGCHESPNSAPPVRRTTAGVRAPSEIEPWHGPARGFDFEREVQPVLDQYCVACHNGKPAPAGRAMPDLRALRHFPDYQGLLTNVPAWWSDNNPVAWVADLMRQQDRKTIHIRFTPAYEALHPYVRRPGLESDYTLPVPAEYHAGTSELIQMLEKGHHGVRLDREAWDRLATWIDLNVPCHGTWSQVLPVPFDGIRRRRELLRLYANFDDDFEVVPEMPRAPITPVKPAPAPVEKQAIACPGWPFDIQEARERQRAIAAQTERWIDLGNGARLKLVLVPGGEFVMGDPDGEADERPPARVRIDEPFWMGALEVTNAQYRLFSPQHDSGYINQLNTNLIARGHPVNQPDQPVVRVSWEQALQFCRWLSQKTGEAFTLPTEAQWEWACRAGTATPLYYGGVQTRFQQWANMADSSLKQFAEEARIRGKLYAIQPDWMLRVDAVFDGALVTTRAGSYLPNAWGLHDMHGNAGEWTRSGYKPYPYREESESAAQEGDKVVRGGSWYDRPHRCRSAFRWRYPGWQRVYNVGFRVISPARGWP
jgi:formylglycine-generating enzyme required for sulfatase activity